jgi:hypothetical protein
VLQVVPQPPQLPVSIVVFVHVPLHRVKLPVQALQADPEHVRRAL